VADGFAARFFSFFEPPKKVRLYPDADFATNFVDCSIEKDRVRQ